VSSFPPLKFKARPKDSYSGSPIDRNHCLFRRGKQKNLSYAARMSYREEIEVMK